MPLPSDALWAAAPDLEQGTAAYRPPPAPADDVLYLVDSTDRLAGVGGGWDEFALRNAAPHLTDRGILGRPLWDFVSDPGTRAVYLAVLARVRAGRTVTFPLRCDSPAVRRLLSVQVSPSLGGLVGFRVRTVREEPRPAVPLLDPATPRSGTPLRMCGWCQQVDVAGGWAEVEDAVARLGLFERPVVPAVTHGMCGDCEGVMTALLDGP